MKMKGIDLNQPICFRSASLRFFKAGEHHVTRYCNDDVLLLVYDGVLRFSENGIQHEVSAGQYYIQRHGMQQGGEIASDKPKYLYIHFFTDAWREQGEILPKSGTFQYLTLKNNMEEMNRLSHSSAPYIAKAGKFYNILTSLCVQKNVSSVATEIANYIVKHCDQKITLPLLCQKFHFSKNHIINIFQKSYGMTPIAYFQLQRLQKAEDLMEMTSDTLESIAIKSGFNHYSYFYKLFMRKNSIAPEKWRKMKRLGQ